MANNKSSDTRPCRKRYTAEQRWIKNKKKKLKKLYKKHFNYSQNKKKKDLKLSKDNRPQTRKYFFEKYPQFEDFLLVNKINEKVISRRESVKPTFKIPDRFKIYERR